MSALTYMVAIALGGRPGERITERLPMPVRADTLLRLLRHRTTPTPPDVRVVGIDDFALPKGQRYGTIICDLERRRTIDLLPDRECGTVADWSDAHSDSEIVCRDRGSNFREGVVVACGMWLPGQLRREAVFEQRQPDLQRAYGKLGLGEILVYSGRLNEEPATTGCHAAPTCTMAFLRHKVSTSDAAPLILRSPTLPIVGQRNNFNFQIHPQGFITV